MRKATLVLFPLFLTMLILILPVHAEGEIDASDLGKQLGQALGLGDFAGGILATTIILMCALGVVGSASKRRPSKLEILLVAFPIYGIAVALAWFPAWLFVVVVLVIAILYGKKIVGVFR